MAKRKKRGPSSRSSRKKREPLKRRTAAKTAHGCEAI